MSRTTEMMSDLQQNRIDVLGGTPSAKVGTIESQADGAPCRKLTITMLAVALHRPIRFAITSRVELLLVDRWSSLPVRLLH